MSVSWKAGSLAFGIIVAVLLAAVSCPVAVAAKPKSSARLTTDEQREVNRLMVEFRAAGADMDKRQEVLDRVLALGPGAAVAAAAAVERELRPQLRHYSSRFQQQAALIGKKKAQGVDINEVVELRQKILGLQLRGEGFTKETIIREGDPALKRLEEIFVIDRAKVLEASEPLKAERKHLEAMGKLWQECQAKVPPPPASEGQEPPKPPNFEEYLEGEERLAAALATPMDAKTRAILALNARLADQIDPEEARTILALNLTRNLLGLSALATDVKLCLAARDHSHDMETLHFFAHESPVEGKKLPWDRARLFGTTACAENIFMGRADGREANTAWFHSPGHHKNMLTPSHIRVGVGRSGVYFTEEFGR